MFPGNPLEGAIAATVAYFDVFSFAPHAGEIHRFLVQASATRDEVDEALRSSPALSSVLDEDAGCYFLQGKRHLVPRRHRFKRNSERLWEQARRIGRGLERTGLGLCGLVTGSLAIDNADEHADIDFMIIYPSHRLWTSYLAARLASKLPFAGMSAMCANYALPSDRLEVRPQNLFTAWQIGMAVPLFGLDTYRRFVEANGWVSRYLPNALPPQGALATAAPPKDPWPKMERIAASRPFRALEDREMRRKSRAEKRDVGVDMQARLRAGSHDRHAPTRSFHALSELRYRLDLLGLRDLAIHSELASDTDPLGREMWRWGDTAIASTARAP